MCDGAFCLRCGNAIRAVDFVFVDIFFKLTMAI